MMSVKDFLLNHNSKFQRQICSNPEACWFGDYPSLSVLNRHYGTEIAQAWLFEQLIDLSEFIGVKDKISVHQLENCAAVIYVNFYYLKISELMLFFFKFKSGQYEEFYGAVDPLTIIKSLWEFVRTTRETAIRQHEKEIEQEENRRSAPYQMDWEQYCRSKGTFGQDSPLAAIAAASGTSPKEDDDKDYIRQSALDLINNTLGLSEDTLKKARRSFTMYHNCSPEEYVNN